MNWSLAIVKRWHIVNWKRGKVIEKNEEKLFWECEHPTRTDSIVRRPDLTLEDTSNKRILFIDMVCRNNYKKVTKRVEKIGKHHRLRFELQ